jgi:hypothetical protein
LFCIIAALVFSIAPYGIYEIYQSRKWLEKNHPNPAQPWPALTDFYVTIVSAIFIYVTNTLMNKATFKFFYNCCKEKVDDDLRIAKTIKACNNFYKGIYYTIVVLWGYFLLKDEYFLPASLLGSGNLSDLESKFPYYKQPDTMKYFILSTMGFHLFSFVHHAVTKARNDYMEMMLHHAATILLYGLSYYCNRNESGAIVMFLHDWADVPCGFTRCFSETIYQAPTIFFGLVMAVLWFYTRLIVFP